MTLDDYKRACADVLAALPLELCEGRAYYPGEKWDEDLITLCRMHTLYEMAATYEDPEAEPMLFFDYWWSLPVRDELKREVLNQVR